MSAAEQRGGGRGMRDAALWYRLLEFTLGFLSIVAAVAALASQSRGIAIVIVLLSFTILLSAIRMIATGRTPELPPTFRMLRSAGGLLMLLVVLVIVINPALGVTTLIYLVAFGMVVQGFAKLLNAGHRSAPLWLRGSSVATGLVNLALIAITLAFPSLTLSIVTILLSSVAIINGLEGVVAGLQPRDRRQLALLKLVLFSAFYGFVNINWIDLYAGSVPAYHVWLILSYMAPFGVLLVFQGLKDWQLAASLGLLVSLMNDLGYYITGDLFFGRHVAILPWLAGQLGLEGGRVLFNFSGGLFTFPVTSILMGVSVYLRVIVVALVLYHWWRGPSMKR